MGLSTPKLNRQTKNLTLYPYYAGYSHQFVLDIISTKAHTNSHVLDPWSGTGLTSLMAKQLGYSSTGIDINPAMTVIAKANNISRELSLSILSISKDITKKFSFVKVKLHRTDDPLNLWFDEYSVCIIRSLELLVYKLLVQNEGRCSLSVDESMLCSLASFFYVVLFKIVKNLVREKFASSNPTWIKVARNDIEKISITKSFLREKFDNQVNEQLKLIFTVDHFDFPNHQINFLTADSKSLPLQSNNVDFILTSPPYCTRIDYAVSMRPELAVLGLADDKYFKDFRRKITGSPTIRQNVVEQSLLWGNECNRFLHNVKSHSSVASDTYYYNNLIQYFDDIYLSLKEISRVSKPEAYLGIVVQDSFYKDLHNNLPIYFEEMLSSLSFKKIDSIAFKSNSFDNINKKSAQYQKPKKPQEFFLSFTYEGA